MTDDDPIREDVWTDDAEPISGIVAVVQECPGCGAAVAALPGETVDGCSDHRADPRPKPPPPVFEAQDNLDAAREAGDQWEHDHYRRGEGW